MKHIILYFFIGLSLNASAQFVKGQWMLSGSFGFNQSKQNNSFDDPAVNANNARTDKQSNMQLNFMVPYFIRKNLALGIGPNYTESSNSSSQLNFESSSKSHSLKINGVLRKYIPINSDFSLYGDLGVGVGRYDSKGESVNNGVQQETGKTTGENYSVSVAFGVAWFPSKRIGLHAGIGNIGWNSTKNKSVNEQNPNFNSSSKNSGFGSNLNSIILNFGLSYFFKAKEQ